MGDGEILPGLSCSVGEDHEEEANPMTEQCDHKPSPRFKQINREQMVMRAIDVEQLVDQEHPVRAVWEFVGRLDLTSFTEAIRAVEGERGRPTYEPRLMISLWIYSYSRGVGKAREIARLCESDPAYQWLTGMTVVNYHSLSDFRVSHQEAVDKLFVETLAVLTMEGLIALERVMHDGTKIKASASPHSFRKKKTIEEHLEMARGHVKKVEAQTEEQGSRRKAEGQRRAAVEKQQRMEAALEEFKKIRPSKSKKKEERVSESEPEARFMKQNDKGFAPSYNLQMSTDQLFGIIVGAELSQSPADSDELIPGMNRVNENCGKLPEQAVTDGAYATENNIHAMQELGIDLISPAAYTDAQLTASGIDPAFSRQAFSYDESTNSYTCPQGKILIYKGKERRGDRVRYRYRARAADCESCICKQQCCPKGMQRSVVRLQHEVEVVNHKTKMETDEAKGIYKQRGPTAEFPNAWIKEKLGLIRFHVRGLMKARLEAIWVCATYNIQQWIRLRWKPQLIQAKT
jgi:transposase